MSATDHLNGEQFPTVRGYKLFRQNQKTGNLHPLFVDKQSPVPVGQWLPAHDNTEMARRAGLQPRPGWHAATKPDAPHLMNREGQMMPGRVWAEIEMPKDESRYYERPESQGGDWLLGGRMRVNRILQPHEYQHYNDQAKELKAAQAAKRATRKSGR